MAEGLPMMDVLKSFSEYVQITLFCSVVLDRQACNSCEICYEVCPVGCFRLAEDGWKIELRYPDLCIACGACQLQCPSQAARLLPKTI